MLEYTVAGTGNHGVLGRGLRKEEMTEGGRGGQREEKRPGKMKAARQDLKGKKMRNAICSHFPYKFFLSLFKQSRALFNHSLLLCRSLTEQQGPLKWWACFEMGSFFKTKTVCVCHLIWHRIGSQKMWEINASMVFLASVWTQPWKS